LRLEILYLYGGIYVDADTVCQKSFNDLPIDGVDLFAAHENEFSKSHKDLIANGVMGSSQYNQDIFALVSRLDRIDIDEPWMTTGPCLVTQSLFNKRSKICPNNKIGYVGGKSNNARIFSSRYFYPIHHSGFKGPGTEEEAIENAITLQMWGTTKGVYKKLKSEANASKAEKWNKLT
jgi:hypothetical protein